MAGFKTRRDEIIPTLRPGASAAEIAAYNKNMSDVLAKNFRATNDDLNNLKGQVESAMTSAGKRQTVLSGAVDSNGFPNFISAGSGLAVNIACATTPAYLSWASGYDAPYDYIKKIEADGSFSGLTPYANPFLYVENDGGGNLTYGHSIYAPVYDTVFRGVDAGAILANFEGTNGATTYTDSYNNAWLLNNGASLSNAQRKFNATTSLYLAGGDDHATVPCPDLSGKWTIEAWIRPSYSSSSLEIIRTNSYSIVLQTDSSNKLSLYLSSNNSSYNIASASKSTSSLLANTWYHIALVFTGAAYVVYINGTAEITVTTTTQVYNVKDLLYLGFTSSSFQGYMEGFRFSPYARYTAAFTAPTAAFVPDEVHFFDLNKMSMYKGYAGNWTKCTRLFVGECKTGASAVSSVVTYALNGRYDSGRITLSTSTTYVKSHNIGMKGFHAKLLVAKVANGVLFEPLSYYDSTKYIGQHIGEYKRNTIKLRTTGYLRGYDADSTGIFDIVEANIQAERSW